MTADFQPNIGFNNVGGPGGEIGDVGSSTPGGPTPPPPVFVPQERIISVGNGRIVQVGNHRVIGAAKPSYPASIVTKGLQSVWDLYSTAFCGRSQPTTKKVGVDMLPAGAVVGRDPDGQPAVVVTGSCDLSNWDMTGYSLVVNGTLTLDVEQAQFAMTTGQQRLMLFGNTGIGTPTVNLSRCSADGTNQARNFGEYIRVEGNTIFNSDRCFYTKPLINQMAILSTNPSSLTHNYFTCPGIGSRTGDHLESIFYRDALAHLLENNLFDYSDGVGVVGTPTTGHLSSAVFVNSIEGDTQVNMTGNVMVNVLGVGTPFDVNGGPVSPHTVALAANNNVLARATFGYFVNRSTFPITGAGNIDFNTSAPITLP